MKPSVWTIPSPFCENGTVKLGALAQPLEKENEQIVGRELDAERFVANARAIAPSLLVLQNLAELQVSAGGDALANAELRSNLASPEDLRKGIRLGAQQAKAYLQERRWKRHVGRPTTAIVMSGGSGNGSFTAGFLWRLTDVLQTCGASGDKTCPNAGIDLAIGTSTGSIIGAMLDVFSTPGQEQRGRDLMMHNYTCSRTSGSGDSSKTPGASSNLTVSATYSMRCCPVPSAATRWSS
jgi:hypothetical protein